MKKVIHFSKGFGFTAIISIALIVFGIVGFFTKGINFGIDFKPGLIEEVRVVPTAIELSYKGASAISVQTSAQGIDLVITGAGSEGKTEHFQYISYATIGELADAINSLESVTAVAKAPRNEPAADLFGSSSKNTILSTTPYRLFYAPANPSIVDIEEVRTLFEDMTGSSVKQSGEVSENTFQIRVGDDGTDTEISKKIQENIANKFESKYGEDNIAVIKTDFVASKFSGSLSIKAIMMVVLSLVLIWLYATIRFKWDFALGAVLAIVHDALIMLTFMIWTGMEFSSITLAALLTIIGYSINDTVVVFDRVRENIKTVKLTNIKDMLDLSQSENLGRTIITTLTTMLAVVSLYIFATGSMKDFALAMLVGMVSGVYSTIYIASGFVALIRKNWKPSDEEKKSQTKVIDEITE